jgi:hypothetical protein
MRYEASEGANVFFFLVAVLPPLAFGILGLGWTAVSRTVFGGGEDQVSQLIDTLSSLGTADAATLDRLKALYAWMSNPWLEVAGVVTLPLRSFAELYVFAGATHLVLRLQRRATRPFTATLKAFAYSFSPAIIALVPCCGTGCMGDLLVLTWATLLAALGVSRAHGISFGQGLSAIVTWHLAIIVGAFLLILPFLPRLGEAIAGVSGLVPAGSF